VGGGGEGGSVERTRLRALFAHRRQKGKLSKRYRKCSRAQLPCNKATVEMIENQGGMLLKPS
jgi:hypothetical protein